MLFQLNADSGTRPKISQTDHALPFEVTLSRLPREADRVANPES